MKKKEWKVNRPKGWALRNDFESVILNEYGYYELRRMNTQEERNRNFAENYFQNYSGDTYFKEYPEEELAFIKNKIVERAYVIEQNLEETGGLQDGRYSLLDIGCGEGFLLQHFHERGVEVKGLDIGSYALEYFHPHLLPYLEQGNMEHILPEMAERGEKFTVINMDRVLDMVLNPGLCLEQVKALMTGESILVINVANNYSYLQQMLLETGELAGEHWLDDPDHTGYFNREGMIRLLEAHGFMCMDFYGDTFVDFHLLNPMTNYYEKPEIGKAAHKMTVRMENLLHDTSLERTVEIYRMLGDMGFGREIVGVFRIKK